MTMGLVLPVRGRKREAGWSAVPRLTRLILVVAVGAAGYSPCWRCWGLRPGDWSSAVLAQ